MELLNIPTEDGYRQFLRLPENASFKKLYRFLKKNHDFEITEYLTDYITEVWIVFLFKGYKFSINNHYGEYCFFVSDLECPDEVLLNVASYCAKLLN